MNKRVISIVAVVLLMLVSCGDNGDDNGDAGNTGDSGNTGNTGDTADTGNTGDTGNSGNSGNTGDTGNTGDPCDEGDVRNCVDFDSFDRCVDGTWETISLTHDGLEWSCVAPGIVDHYEAISYCGDNGGRLPTISELRTLIQNCPDTETGGACGVTDSCLHSDCWNDACDGCSSDFNGKYSVFGDTGWLWSSSVQSDDTDYAWNVYFYYGYVSFHYRYYYRYVRCVRGR